MVRIGCTVVILHVTRTAGTARKVVVTVRVALRAWQAGMRPGQGKTHRVVVKVRWRPCAGVVAGLTSLREIEGHVLGIGGLLKIR